MARNLPYSYDVDATYYYAMYPDVAASGEAAARHYHFDGWHEGRNPNEFFDTLGYLTTYQDVAAAGIDPLAHFHNFGFREGRTPSPAFDAQAYLNANPDVAAAGIDPLAHYLRFGRSEGRQAIAKPIYDADGNGNVVTEHSGGGTGTGVTFSWGGFVSPNLTYSLIGDSSGGGFAVNGSTGQVYVADGSKIDYFGAGPSHSYVVTVQASDLGHTITQSATIAVRDSNDFAPVFSSGTTGSEAENTAATNVVYQAQATDPDSTSPNNAVTYSLAAGVGDNDQFSINATTGAVTFKTSPNYEAPTDGNGDNAYNIVVTATDGGTPALSTSRNVTITVTDVNDNTPVITSGATATTPENVSTSTAVYTATATDADGTAPNNTIRYSLSGTDAGLFNINATTGAVTFKASPNYEAPADSGANNVYDVVVTATDGGNPALSSSKAVAITVTDVNEFTPVITSGAAATTPENVSTSTAVYTATATDGDGSAPNKTVTYSLATGGDNGLFNIDSSSGAVTFKASPNYEAPTDTGANNVYDITVIATDGGNPALSSSKAVAITVTDVNDNAPVITSGTSASTPENVSTGTAVYTATATDADGTAPNNTIRYSLSGTDANLFNINATTGAVTFKASPNYEAPADSGANNVYDVVVTATDGGNPALSSSKAVAITVTDVNDNTPVITSGASASTPENVATTTAVYTASATDADGTAPNNTIRYSLGGTDAGLFNIDASSGAVTFKASPNYEAPADNGGNNVYDIVVTATDGGNPALSSNKAVAITVTDVNDNAPVITSGATGSEAENTAASNVVYTVTATDADGTAPNKSITYSIGGTDANAFNINANSGAVTFKTAPNYEAPTDSGGNNVYDIVVTATDGGNPALSSSKAVAITVTDVNDNAPVITSGASASTPENVATSAIVYTATATDADGTSPNNAVRYSLSGTDAGLFNIDASSGAVTFKASPNYEAPADNGGNNVYDIVVTATDSGNPALSSTKAVAITVTDVNDNAPVITSGAAASTPENATGTVYTATATDADGTAPNKTITYSLAQGGDNDLFNINATTGAVAFKTAPDYETPADAGANNVYDITVVATDGGNPALSSNKAVAITVTDANDNAPVITSGNAASTAEGTATTTAVYTATATDADGTAPNKSITYSLSGTDAGLFNINATSGAVTFKASPNYEAPADNGGNNVYDIIVTATDGGNPALSSSKAVAITVTDLPPSTPVDSDGNPNQTFNGAPAGSGTGVTAASMDPAGGTVTFALLDDSGAVADADGRFAIDAMGVVTVSGTTPIVYNAGGNNDYTITVRASDMSGQHTSQTFTITVSPNAPPVIDGGDTASYSTPENSTTVATIHATDPDHAPNPAVSYSIVTGAGSPDSGKFTIDGSTGALSFITPPNFEAPGSAANSNTYTVQVAASDGAASDTQTITVTVTNVNEAPTANPDAVSATEAGGAANGTPGVNPGIGTDPGFNVITGTGETITTGADTDPDAGDTRTVQGVVAGTTGTTQTMGANADVTGTYGKIHINSDGSATYTVDNANTAVQALRTSTQVLTDTYSYTIKDAGNPALTSTTQVTVTIHGQNDDPTANLDTGSATEKGGTGNNTGGSPGTGNVLNNDTDPDSGANGETLAVQGVAAGNSGTTQTGNVGMGVAGRYGTLTLNAAGTYSYVVNESAADSLIQGQSAHDVFTYTIRDSAGATSTTTLDITVNGANDGPTAGNDTVPATEDTPTGGLKTMLLANDTDPDGSANALTITAVGTASHGTVNYNNGNPIYTPNANYSGQDSFSYTISDGQYTSTATAIVNISPVADTPTYTRGSLQPAAAGNEFQVNSGTTSGSQNGAVVTALSGGGYAVVWQDGNTAGLAARIYDASGTPGGSFVVAADPQGKNGTYAYNSGTTAVSALSAGAHAGGFVEIDLIQNAATGSNQIEGRFVSSTGSVGTAFVVSAEDDLSSNLGLGPVTSAAFADGSFVVIWQVTHSANSSVLEVQRFNAAGNAVHQDGMTPGLQPFQVGNSTGVQAYPDVAVLSNGNFVVSWNADPDGGAITGTETYYQIFNPAGGPVTGIQRANFSTTGGQYSPAVTALQDGGFAISWTQDLDINNSNPDVYTRVFNSAGTAVSGDILVNDANTTGSQNASSITALADGGFLVSWTGTDTNGTTGVFAQRYDMVGQKIGVEFEINQTVAGAQLQAGPTFQNPLAVLNTGQLVDVWESNQAGNLDVYARVFNLPGDGAQGGRITLTSLSSMVTDTVGTSPTNGGQEVVKEIDLSGFPAGSTFSIGGTQVGHASGNTWVIDSATDINNLKTMALQVTPPAGYPAAGASGHFTLTATAVVTDTATLSTGTVTDTKTFDLKIEVGVKAPGDPIFAADTAGVTALHLDAVAPGDTVTITKLPGNGDFLLANGHAVHEGQTLSADQYATLAFRPIDAGHDTSSVVQFTVSNGTTTTASTIPVYVAHGSGLTMNGSTGTDHIIGSPGADTLVGHGGQDVLTGGGGADHFVFDQTSIAGPQAAHITDYDAHLGSVIDVTAITQALGANGQDAAALYHVQEDAGGTSATLTVNTGTAQAPHWAEIAHLDGLQAGADVDLAVDPAHPAASVHLHVDGHAGIV